MLTGHAYRDDGLTVETKRLYGRAFADLPPEIRRRSALSTYAGFSDANGVAMARTGIIRRAVAVGATVLALIGSSGGAAADAGTQAPPANVVEVSSADTGFTAPDTASPGVAQFRMVTTSEGSGWIGLARLNAGVSWETFRANLAKTVSDTPADVAAGSAALAKSATLLGGVVIHPGLPGALTQLLQPGRYVLFDYRFLAPTDARYRFLTVTGSPGYSPLDFSGTLVATSVPGVGPRFSLLGEVRAGQPLLLHNACRANWARRWPSRSPVT